GRSSGRAHGDRRIRLPATADRHPAGLGALRAGSELRQRMGHLLQAAELRADLPAAAVRRGDRARYLADPSSTYGRRRAGNGPDPPPPALRRAGDTFGAAFERLRTEPLAVVPYRLSHPPGDLSVRHLHRSGAEGDPPRAAHL